ncbi:hypothetical protein F5Y06DRAFT_303893 [Hypoxylon sp. FL0890]|nr:hypothetical protein F5Y06DRAFT_303893 [Hypoxylon sp. FL0890]
MAPSYAGQSFTAQEAIEAAGPPPSHQAYGYEFAWQAEPPREFFKDVHWEYAHAIFSTNNGATPFRTPEDPVNNRDVEFWDAAKIQAYADEIRSKFYNRCMYIRTLESYEGLYIYWDAHDIYHLGALNLWRVIHHLGFENQYLMQEHFDSTNQWVKDYVDNMLSDEGNRKKLLEWNCEVEDITAVFHDGELDGLDGLEKYYCRGFRDAILTNYLNLRRGYPIDANYQIYVNLLEVDEQPNKGNAVEKITIVDGTSASAAQKIAETLAGCANNMEQTEKTEKTEQTEQTSTAQPVASHDMMGPGGINNQVPSNERVEPSRTRRDSMGAFVERYFSGPTFSTGRGGSAIPGRAYYRGNRHAVTQKLTAAGDPVIDPLVDAVMGPTIDSAANSPVEKSAVSPAVTSTINTRTDTRQRRDALGRPGTVHQFLVHPWHALHMVANMPPHFYMQPNVGAQLGMLTRPPQQHPLQPYPPQPYPPQQYPPQQRPPQFHNALFAPAMMLSPPIPHNVPYPPHQQMAPHQQMVPHQPPHRGPSAPVDIRVNSQPFHAAHPQNQPPTRQHSASSSGTWKVIGQDPLHGPKSVFSKNSSPDQSMNQGQRWNGQGYNQNWSQTDTQYSRQGRRQANEIGPWASIVAVRRPSLDKTDTKDLQGGQGKGHYRNNSVQHHTDLELFAKGVPPDCVNKAQYLDRHPTTVKFHACPCRKCKQNDCTLFITGMKDETRDDPSFPDRMMKYFLKHGDIVSTWWHPKFRGLYIRFMQERDALKAMHAEQHKTVNRLNVDKMHIGFRIGSQHFKPSHPFRPHDYNYRDYGSQSQPSASGPTHPMYAQASSTTQGLATVGLRVNPQGDYRVPTIPESVSSVAAAPADETSSHEWVQKIKYLNLGQSNAEAAHKKTSSGEASRSSSGKRYYTPPEQPIIKVDSPTLKPAVTANASLMDIDDSIIDCGTVIRRPRKARFHLPYNWGSQEEGEPHGEPATECEADKGEGYALSDMTRSQGPSTHGSHESSSSGYHTALEYLPDKPGPSGTQGRELSSTSLQPPAQQPGPSQTPAEEPRELTTTIPGFSRSFEVNSPEDMKAFYLALADDPNFADNMFKKTGILDATEEDKRMFVERFRDSLLNGNANVDHNYLSALFENLNYRLQEMTRMASDPSEQRATSGSSQSSLQPFPEYDDPLVDAPAIQPENEKQAEDSASVGSAVPKTWPNRRNPAKSAGKQAAGNGSKEQPAATDTYKGGKSRGKAPAQSGRQPSNVPAAAIPKALEDKKKPEDNSEKQSAPGGRGRSRGRGRGKTGVYRKQQSANAASAASNSENKQPGDNSQKQATNCPTSDSQHTPSQAPSGASQTTSRVASGPSSAKSVAKKEADRKEPPDEERKGG